MLHEAILADLVDVQVSFFLSLPQIATASTPCFGVLSCLDGAPECQETPPALANSAATASTSHYVIISPPTF
jgi:hypothetical protein